MSSPCDRRYHSGGRRSTRKGGSRGPRAIRRFPLQPFSVTSQGPSSYPDLGGAYGRRTDVPRCRSRIITGASRRGRAMRAKGRWLRLLPLTLGIAIVAPIATTPRAVEPAKVPPGRPLVLHQRGEKPEGGAGGQAGSRFSFGPGQ